MARQILVIDDSSTMRQCIEWTFAFEDFVVASASSFQEAIVDVDTVQPDVVLLDHDLGDVATTEAVSDIAQKLGRQPTIIVMHQHDMPLSQGELERIHATAQVPKPFETQRLIDTVKWSLGMPVTTSVAASRAYRWTPPTQSPDFGDFEIPAPTLADPPSVPPVTIPVPNPSLSPEPPAIIAPPPVEESTEAGKQTETQENDFEESTSAAALDAPPVIAPPTVEAAEPPAVLAPPPVEPTEPPAILAPPPVEPTEPPAILAPPPVEPTEPPAILAPPPVEPTEPPAILAPPPVEPTEPPAILAPPPVEPTEPPAILAPPPAEPPAVIAPPPAESVEPPAILAPPPAEPPAIIAPPPVESDEPPAILAPPSVEAPSVLAPTATETPLDDGSGEAQMPETSEPVFVDAPPVFRAPPPPVVESDTGAPSQHAPFHPDHEPDVSAESAPEPIDALEPPKPNPLGTTEIDVSQLSLADDQLDPLESFSDDDAPIEPDDFFAAPAPEAMTKVVDEAKNQILDEVEPEEVARLEKLAHDIVERVAWEVIPDIVERVVRERLNRDS